MTGPLTAKLHWPKVFEAQIKVGTGVHSSSAMGLVFPSLISWRLVAESGSMRPVNDFLWSVLSVVFSAVMRVVWHSIDLEKPVPLPLKVLYVGKT